MSFVMILMVLNISSGIVFWYTDLTVYVKIVVTLLLVVQYVALFYGTFIANIGTRYRYCSLLLCTIMNIGLLIYTIVISLWLVTINIVSTLLLLLIWNPPSILISKEEEKDK